MCDAVLHFALVYRGWILLVIVCFISSRRLEFEASTAFIPGRRADDDLTVDSANITLFDTTTDSFT